MELIKLLEAGESPALQGIALSFHTPDASRPLADILAGLRRGQRRILTGNLSRTIYWMSRLLPNAYPALLRRLTR